MMGTKTLDMTLIRNLNLFEKITRIRTDSCFIFNNTMFFAVPKEMVFRAIGKNGENAKMLSEILGKKVKIVGLAEGGQDISRFIKDIIAPVQPKNIEVTEKEIIITAGRLNHAALVGRDKQKLHELEKVVGEHFGKSLRVV
jgi:transcription antitermination factor NusA-like protein